ncbi:MAG: phosphatidylglycerophosphatase [Candidatus Dependentiae bacterium]|nr:phosphatidylglycerophosphatase [Candidatus Dependentiae bacterium]
MNVNKIAIFIASCGGLGHSRWMPGTMGSVGAMIAQYGLRTVLSLEILVFLGICMTGLGFWATCRSITSPTEDPSWIVIDEWCAVWFMCCALLYVEWCYLLGCFIFRILDIAKTWPVSLAERAPGAWGIFLDDFVAAFLTVIFLSCCAIPAIL